MNLSDQIKTPGPVSGKEPGKREDFLTKIPKGGVGAELGVFKGEFSVHLLEVCRPGKLYLIDVWWERYGEYYPDWGAYTDFGKLKTSDAYEMTRAISDKHKKGTTVELCVGDDLTILSNMPDECLDWVYIDSAHGYQHTVNELTILNNKMKPCGLITGHDWRPDPQHEHHGVFKAVNEFCAREGWKITSLDHHSQWCIERINAG